MRARRAVLSRHRRGGCTRADRGSGRGLALGPGGRGGARRRRRVGRLLRLGANRLRFVRRRLGIRDGLGGLGSAASGPASARAAPRLQASPAAGSARSAPATASAARRLGRRGIGLLHLGSRRDIHRRRLRRGRNRRHVHHDRRERRRRVPAAGVYQFNAKRDQRRMRGDDRGRRYSPAPDDGLVGDIMQSERVHGASFGRRGRPARS